MCIRNILLAFFSFILISGCAGIGNEDAEIKRYQEPRYRDDAPIRLSVSQVDIRSEFMPSFTRPNVEHLFPVSIEKTAKLWARDRLQADDFSSQRRAEFIIRDASVTETVQNSEKLFYKDHLIYKAHLVVVLRIIDDSNKSKAETEIDAWRELTIPADSSIADKEKYWNTMVDKLFTEFNIQMDQNIRKYLNMYVMDNTHIQTYDY